MWGIPESLSTHQEERTVFPPSGTLRAGSISRREILLLAGAVPFASHADALLGQTANSPSTGRSGGYPIGVSTYSFWQFKNEELRDIEKCIDLAGEWGFDGVEILHRQMTSEDNGYRQRLKRRSFVNGLALCGFSTHQGFVSPQPEERQKNIDHTIHCIELAYSLGIPPCA
jgi:hypothetical protein